MTKISHVFDLRPKRYPFGAEFGKKRDLTGDYTFLIT